MQHAHAICLTACMLDCMHSATGICAYLCHYCILLHAGSRVPAGSHLVPGTDVPQSCAFLQAPGPTAEDKPVRCILQEFLRKVLRLAANRSHDLCSRLEIVDAHRQEIETQVSST